MTKTIKVNEYNTGAKAITEWPEVQVTLVGDNYFSPETNNGCPEISEYGIGRDGDKSYSVYKAWNVKSPERVWFVAKEQ